MLGLVVNYSQTQKLWDNLGAWPYNPPAFSSRFVSSLSYQPCPMATSKLAESTISSLPTLLLCESDLSEDIQKHT